jgi:fumarate hydratase class II
MFLLLDFVPELLVVPVYKPLMIANLSQSIMLLSDGCVNFRTFLIEGTQPNREQVGEYVNRSPMLVTALAPVIGCDKASKIAQHHALEHDLTSRDAALQLGYVGETTFDRVVYSAKMVKPYGGGEQVLVRNPQPDRIQRSTR